MSAMYAAAYVLPLGDRRQIVVYMIWGG